MGRKVAIIAKGAGALQAPWDDPKWEIWGMPWVIGPRHADLYFDVHSAECWLKADLPEEDKHDWVQRTDQSGVPIYCHPSRCYLFKAASPFPFDSVDAVSPKRLYENSIAYQLAFALWSHKQDPLDEVGLWGVNMMGEREYLWERASVLYHVGLLEGHGVKVTVPPGSPLFMSYWTAGRYGITPEKRFQLTRKT